MIIRLAGVVKESIVDGPGLRYTIFVQGCPHGCAGCHNPHTHDFAGGYLADTDGLFADIRKNPLLSGVTYSGGEPFCQCGPLYELGLRLRDAGYHIMTYTGYTFEGLLAGANEENGFARLLAVTDILVDGPFELEKRNLLLKFRGSDNQRILNCQESLNQHKAVPADI